MLVCAGTGCVSNNSYRIKEALEDEIERRGLSDEVLVVATGCQGFCAAGPIVMHQPDGIFYQLVTEKDVPLIVEEHLLKGRPVTKLMYTPPEEKVPIPKVGDIDFFKKQLLIALRNRGLLDPEKIEEYIARDGYVGLAKALTEMTPGQVLDEVVRSGLRGRGGAGFPTGLKWKATRDVAGEHKYVVCNADEGDPGAFMDRSILEADPHAVLEGMTIGAYAVGAHHGFVYVRNEYPLALKRLEIAIPAAREYGLLGENILDTGFSFDVEVHRGAGAFVCGEETALIFSLEGRPGEPRTRPPFPAEKGFEGHPTNINNVETWANVPQIISRGAEWFNSIGTDRSKGTKVFSLVGKIKNTGLVEVPMGIKLREIIYDIGGGIRHNKAFKAVQTGGPSGGCIPSQLIDLPVDFESLTDAGSMMGSGGMVVMDEDDCMVDVARYFVNFLKDESCGKCTPCREGIRNMLTVLERISDGKGREGDIELLEEMSEVVRDSSLCGLGKTAANPVLSTIRYFRPEYEAHIRERKCPAGVCKALVTYSVDAAKCTGCTLCVKSCPIDHCITGESKKAHSIDTSLCIKCGACFDVCRFDAVLRQ
jgi:NADP-reducing hydrogenase subunit HndC